MDGEIDDEIEKKRPLTRKISIWRAFHFSISNHRFLRDLPVVTFLFFYLMLKIKGEKRRLLDPEMKKEEAHRQYLLEMTFGPVVPSSSSFPWRSDSSLDFMGFGKEISLKSKKSHPPGPSSSSFSFLFSREGKERGLRRKKPRNQTTAPGM